MKFVTKFFPLFLLLIFSVVSLAQDTIVFINGRKIPAINPRLSDLQVLYNPVKKPQNLKKAEAYNIFSIKHQNGDETLIYKQDTLIDDFTVDQMRMFVKGQQDALIYYNTTAVTVASTLIGVGSGLTLQFFALAPPAIFATIVGASSPNMESQPIQNKELLNSPEYRMGYESKARNMKIKRALIFGIGGAIVGYAGFRVIKASED